jgi:Nucleotidyl transferase AbiEii toxin, Type IV TA system
MFNQPIHNQILQILQALNSDLLTTCKTYFGGGTLLALSYNEYRLSRDIDFMCPYGTAFSQLRNALYDRGYDALFDRPQHPTIQLPGELRTDRYGIRFPVQIDQTIIKFEIVAEGRINLDTPHFPAWTTIPCLNIIDQIAEKLLANSDRWADTSTDSRDLIDLTILRLKTTFPPAAIKKAEAAYRCIDPLKRSILNFQSKPDYRLRCYQRLNIQSPQTIINGLDQLATQFELPLTNRITEELDT